RLSTTDLFTRPAMGSKKPSKSTRAARRKRPSRPFTKSPAVPVPHDSAADLLNGVDEAIAVVVSAWLAFEMRQSEHGAMRLDMPLDTDPLVCLRHGCQRLRATFAALDNALAGRQS
ncbi:MAG: hypothetical protein ABI885_13955, partial [Gammaproteobacteria bacterium]